MTVQSTLITCVGWAALLAGPSCAWGQYAAIWIDRPLIRYAEGKVLLDGQNVALRPDKFLLLDGQVLGTAEGRVQTALVSVFLAETNAYLAENSSLRMLSGQLPAQAIEILSGSTIIECTLSGKDMGAGLSVRYKEVTIDLSKSGEYRIDADLGRLRVYQGDATVTYGVSLECAEAGGCRRIVGRRPANTVQVHKGEQVSLDESLLASTFNAKETDAFSHWVRRRVAGVPRRPPMPPGRRLPFTPP